MNPDDGASDPPAGWIRNLLPYLALFAMALALGGFALAVLIPSQIFKPDALRAQALVEQNYREMLDAALRDLPVETTADIAKEACWTEGKRLCI